MLYTNLRHIESAKEHQQFINENENVMICCGRMGSMCVPIYGIMETIEGEYTHVKFADMEFDNPEANVIRETPECGTFSEYPYTVYYKRGKLVMATSGIQTMQQVRHILDENFAS